MSSKKPIEILSAAVPGLRRNCLNLIKAKLFKRVEKSEDPLVATY
jgi:hypothetical protein